MHDIRAIRADPKVFDAAMERRGLLAAGSAVGSLAQEILYRDENRRAKQTQLQDLQAFRKETSRQIGENKRQGKDTSELEALVAAERQKREGLEREIAKLEVEIRERLETLPNILDPDVPDGADETANVMLKQVGQPRPLNFEPKQHFELGEALGMMQFEQAAKLAGARFTIIRGALARLERALGQFMLDLHTQRHGYEEVQVPLLVNAATMYGTGQLPKFEADLFRTTDDRYLIPTAEVPLTNYARDEILADRLLPLRQTALTDCFRSEAGSAGRDTRGMLRQHQFHKVELVSITRPEDSAAEHERMTACAEKVLELLQIPYRRMLLCAGDTGFGSAKTYDLEVWLPGQQMWREISSCSNCRDFQARRMNARYRAADGKPAFVHTLNGSGVAVGRALIAVMENHQQADGSILVPEALWPWTGGMERIATA
jgi:seryl-tRNA synthetase